ncbi:MAG: hypothetical protein ACK55I_39920, partial [bacterium]
LEHRDTRGTRVRDRLRRRGREPSLQRRIGQVTRRPHPRARGRALEAWTELQRRDLREPAPVLHDHRIVQAVAILQIGLHLHHATGVAHLPAAHLQAGTDAAGRHGHQAEDQQGDPQQRGDH